MCLDPTVSRQTGVSSSAGSTAQHMQCLPEDGIFRLRSRLRPAVCILTFLYTWYSRKCSKKFMNRFGEAIRATGYLSPRQFGFGPGRSTVNAVVEVVDGVHRIEAHVFDIDE